MRAGGVVAVLGGAGGTGGGAAGVCDCDVALSGAEAGVISVTSAKEDVMRILEDLPEDVSFEDIQYHIYVRQKIERGLEDVEAGRTLSEEEFDRRMAKWLAR